MLPALRVLIHLGRQGERPVAPSDVAAACAIGTGELDGIVSTLIGLGHVTAGAGGELRLASPPAALTLRRLLGELAPVRAGGGMAGLEGVTLQDLVADAERLARLELLLQDDGEPVEPFSPVCYAGEVDPAYMGLDTPGRSKS